jgi:hypothetical protein
VRPGPSPQKDEETMPRNQKRDRKKTDGAVLPVMKPDAAGIDIGATEIYVAVPADRDG